MYIMYFFNYKFYWRCIKFKVKYVKYLFKYYLEFFFWKLKCKCYIDFVNGGNIDFIFYDSLE